MFSKRVRDTWLAFCHGNSLAVVGLKYSLMNLLRLHVILIISVLPVLANENDIVFNGVLEVGEEVRFALSDKAHGHRGWVALGGYFAGGEVLEYSRDDQILTFRRNGQEHSIEMSGAKTFDEANRISFSVPDASDPDGEPSKPFSTVPRALTHGLGARELLTFLLREGYEVPEPLLLRARVDAINNELAPKIEPEPVSAELDKSRSKGRIDAPRNPRITTSFTVEEKILREIIGY